MSLAVALAFWVGTLLSAGTTLKLWNAPATHRALERPPWWLWGDSLWRGFRRALLPASLVSVSFAIALTLPDPAGVYVAVAGLALFLPLMATVVLFNWPKVVVPPSLRPENGVLTAALQRNSDIDSSS